MSIYMEGSIKEKLKNSRANKGFTSRFFRDTNAVVATNMLKDFCIYCTRGALDRAKSHCGGDLIPGV